MVGSEKGDLMSQNRTVRAGFTAQLRWQCGGATLAGRSLWRGKRGKSMDSPSILTLLHRRPVGADQHSPLGNNLMAEPLAGGCGGAGLSYHNHGTRVSILVLRDKIELLVDFGF